MSTIKPVAPHHKSLYIKYCAVQNSKEKANCSADYKQMPNCVRKFQPAPQIENYTHRIRQTASQNKPQATRWNMAQHSRQNKQQSPPHY